jgi:hypothetical protein
MAVDGVYRFPVKRIKKTINDFILNNYNELFFTSKPVESTAAAASTNAEPGSPEKNSSPSKALNSVQAEYQSMELSYEEILQNPKIL